MPRLIDINYYPHLELRSLQGIWEMYRPSFGYIPHLQGDLDIEVIAHTAVEEQAVIEGIKFRSFRRGKRFFSMPAATHRYIRERKPDVILVQGLVFPLQLLALRKSAGPACRILVQHHGELPFPGWKGYIQKMASPAADAFLFTSLGNAGPWMQAGIIKDEGQCHEVLEASTYIQRKDRQQSRARLGMGSGEIFLWVGRLNANKDPLTVLEAFQKYLQLEPEAQLYMIYQTDDLLEEVKQVLSESPVLQHAVHLTGKVPHDELAWWFSAADAYVSGSHKEGSGYALIESMACGCIPVVTDIPSFRKITGGGNVGLLYQPGDAVDMLERLKKLKGLDRKALREAVIQHFRQELSFEAIGRQLRQVIASVCK